MRTKLLLVTTVLIVCWIVYTGFSPNDDSPRWNPDPRTRINTGPVIQEYQQLPYVDNNVPALNEPVYNITPQGIFVVNTPFRVHPITASPSHQTEVPITRHPTNQNIMYASANTSRGGNFSTAWYVTTNAGTSWFGNDTMFNSVGGAVHNFGDPGPVIDGSGRFLISYISLSGGMGASYSTNNGVNWTNTFNFAPVSSPDKNFSSTDDAPSSAFFNRSYTYYTEFAGPNVNRIVGTYTTNQGVSWVSVAPVSPVPGVNRFHQGADTKCGPNGEVYVVWTEAQLVSPYTEDFLGFAKSVNGGVTWTINTNTAANVNGNRTFNMVNNIRVAGFPRIDVDRTCGPRAGWIYVTVGEKNPGVAGDISDIVLYKSTNGGTTWSTGVRVNQDAFGNGKKQYMAAVRVDESGGVNVVYYDTRNSAGNNLSEVFLSRSTDGGVTFVDTKVGDQFTHGPTGVPGVNSQYCGDYIGVTSALIPGNPANGNQRIWPYWMANNGTPGGQYQAFTAKVELLPTRPCIGCEDFSSTAFTPNYFYLEHTGTQYWTRLAASAYGGGAGSARFEAWTAPLATSQSLTTGFTAVGANTYLTFDEAYAPWSGGNVDSLIVETSTNGGTSFSALVRLWGGLGAQAGPLNTVFVGGGQFVPTGGQWRPKIYLLPVGTNKVRLRAVSGFGNDIWVDNVCVQSLVTPIANSIGLLSQGMVLYSAPTRWRFNDTVKVYLHRTDFPNVVVDSATGVAGSNAVFSNLNFTKALNGTYYRVVRHRNSIETWSNAGIGYSRGSNTHFNFVPDGASFGNNQAITKVGPIERGMYSGDCNQDSAIDGTDLSLIDNGAFNFVTGYVVTDLTGDFVVDGSDYAIADNNAFNFVVRVAPAGGEPDMQQQSVPKFETDADRQKYEEGLRIQKDREAMNPPVQTEKMSYKEFLKKMGNPDWEAPAATTRDAIQQQNNLDVRTSGKRVGEL